MRDQKLSRSIGQSQIFKTWTTVLALLLLVTGIEILDRIVESAHAEQWHPGELVERDLVSLNIDYKQMGVGGINSWGPTGLPKYSLYYKEYEYSFRLRPFDASDGTPTALSKELYYQP